MSIIILIVTQTSKTKAAFSSELDPIFFKNGELEKLLKLAKKKVAYKEKCYNLRKKGHMFTDTH